MSEYQAQARTRPSTVLLPIGPLSLPFNFGSFGNHGTCGNLFGSLNLFLVKRPPFTVEARGFLLGERSESRLSPFFYFFEAEMELTVIVSPFSVPFTVAFSPAYLSIADLSPFNV